MAWKDTCTPKVSAALLTAASQMSIHEGVDKEDVPHMHTECYLAVKEKEVLPLATTWKDL